MSLKVYNGIKFKTKKLPEIIKYLHSIKDKAKANSVKHIKEKPDRVIYALTENMDEVFNPDFKLDKWEAQQKLRANLSKTWRTVEDPSFLFSVCIIPWTDGNVYGISYHDDIDENRALLDEIAIEYHYQNQTDKPDEISTRDWNKRGKIWNEIFDDYVSAGDAGMIYEIVKPDDFYAKYIEDAIESYKDQHFHGFRIECNITDVDAYKKSGIIKDILAVCGDAHVRNFSWLSACPGLLIDSKDEEPLDAIEPILKEHPELFKYTRSEAWLEKDRWNKPYEYRDF